MSASLVGSEMCIRDRLRPRPRELLSAQRDAPVHPRAFVHREAHVTEKTTPQLLGDVSQGVL
eukprot:13487359-Alexandrium_andersonii.AAC.1